MPLVSKLVWSVCEIRYNGVELDLLGREGVIVFHVYMRHDM